MTDKRFPAEVQVVSGRVAYEYLQQNAGVEAIDFRSIRGRVFVTSDEAGDMAWSHMKTQTGE